MFQRKPTKRKCNILISHCLISLGKMSKVTWMVLPSEERAFYSCCEQILEHLRTWRSLLRSFQKASVPSTCTFAQNPSGSFPARWCLHPLLQQNKKATWFCCIFTGFLEKKRKKKKSADAVRIMQSDKRSVFLLAVSRNNPSLNKTEDWRDKKQKKGLGHWTLVLTVLPPSYLACLVLLLDNESAKMNR